MGDLQLCGAKQLRKHEVGFIANKNLFFRETRKLIKFLCGKIKPILPWIGGLVFLMLNYLFFSWKHHSRNNDV
jgi:hypothetical protein